MSRQPIKRSHVPRNAFDFKKHVLGESRNLDSGARRLVISKEISIDAIHGSKVVHVLQEYLSVVTGQRRRVARDDTYSRFDDAADVCAARLEDGCEVRKCLLCLWDDAALCDVGGGGDEWDAARDKDEIAGFDRLRVGTDRGGCGWETVSCGFGLCCKTYTGSRRGSARNVSTLPSASGRDEGRIR